MNKRFHVLVFPGGTEIGLEIHQALRFCKEVRLFSAGLDVPNHAPFVFAQHFAVPGIHDPAWIDALNEIIAAQQIDFVFPAYDDIVLALADNAERIHARIVSSPRETCRIARSKSCTYRLLEGAVPVPAVFETSAAIPRYPVFVKPDRGQGSQDTHLVRDEQQLRHVLARSHDAIVLEYLVGDEYTVDCFSDREKGLLFCRGRRRVRTRSGISMNSVPAHDDTFAQYAAAIARKLTFHGAWFFQVKRAEDGTLKLLEVAPRIAGTMATHRVQGVNFPLLSLYEQARIPVEILRNDAAAPAEIDRALVNRYRHDLEYGTVYVDLDDTLLIDGRVNVELVRFLYQCVNQSKRLVLLTRHAASVSDTLDRHRLGGLFDQIIWCDRSACKADYIRETNAIFIDDSFRERRAVSAARGIPTFDCSMLEMLHDERI